MNLNCFLNETASSSTNLLSGILCRINPFAMYTTFLETRIKQKQQKNDNRVAGSDSPLCQVRSWTGKHRYLTLQAD